MERAERIRTQRPKDKGKLYAMHAPEAECIGKGKARQPYEFGVKASVAVTHRQGLIVGARTFPGNPYDGHILAAQLAQTTVLLEDVGRVPKQVVADLGYRGVDADNPTVEILHPGRYRSMTKQQRRWLKRRQAIEPAIGHLKADHRMNRCWLAGSLGDALHAVLCAAGYNLRWLLRAVARGRIRRLFSPSGRLYCNCYSRFQGCRHRRTGALYRHLRWKSEFCRADELWQQRWQRRGWHGF